MYSWGDDTSAWKGGKSYKWDSAKAPYLKKWESNAGSEPREYLDKKGPNLALVEPKGKTLHSDSENPVEVWIDGTGSMASWPAEIFDRLPLFCKTVTGYRQDTEFSFSVIGDATGYDKWPVQVTDFGNGPSLDERLKALYAEGLGGPGIRESYELHAYRALTHTDTPKATSPFLFIMGDESFYETVKPDLVKNIFDDKIQGELSSREIFQELGKSRDIYLLRKPYGAGMDQKIEAQWREAIGSQHIIPIYDEKRIVDVAMGIIAKKWGYDADFENNLEARQDEEGIKSVMASLRAAPGYESAVKSGMKSKTKKALGKGKSIPLLGDGDKK